MSDVVRVRMTATLGFVGADREDYEEFPREEWEEMTPDEREEMLWESAKDFAESYLEYWFEVED
jgi:hypothetical protein